MNGRKFKLLAEANQWKGTHDQDKRDLILNIIRGSARHKKKIAEMR